MDKASESYLAHIDRLLREGKFQLTDEERMTIRALYNAVAGGDLEAADEAWRRLPEPIAAALGAPGP